MLKSANLLHECGLGDSDMNSTVTLHMKISNTLRKDMFCSNDLGRHFFKKSYKNGQWLFSTVDSILKLAWLADYLVYQKQLYYSSPNFD